MKVEKMQIKTLIEYNINLQERFDIELITVGAMKCPTHNLNEDYLRIKEAIEIKVKKLKYNVVAKKTKLKRG